MRTYLITHNNFILPDESLRTFLDTRSEIMNWYRPFVGAVIVVSQHNQTHLSNMLANRYPQKQFIITEMNAGTSDGQLFQQAWDFIKAPKSSGRTTPSDTSLPDKRYTPNYNDLVPPFIPPKKM